MKIIEGQQSLFSIDEYAIESTEGGSIELMSDWGRERANDRLLPNSRKKGKATISSLIFKESREQDEIEKLGSIPNPLLPKSEIREQIKPFHPPPDPLLPKSQIREQTKKKLPNSKIREQAETSNQMRELQDNGEVILGKSIVNVKGTQYILTHSRSDKYMPSNKGWTDIKSKDGKLYLYLRWRDCGIQRSRCLGKLDRLS